MILLLLLRGPADNAGPAILRPIEYGAGLGSYHSIRQGNQSQRHEHRNDPARHLR